MDKYITLRSTDSLAYYPDNTSWSFRVHLDESIRLRQKGVVALAEITFENWDVSKRSDCRDVYIYTSLCEPSHLVGETKEPLLRRLWLKGNKQERSFVFSHYHYLPVRVENTDVIHVYIKDPTGRPASFIRGSVVVTLHLKPVPFWF